MAANIDFDSAFRVFRGIIKRKTIYNETNLHFDYFQLTGDTIPFKDLGYESLKEFILKNASDQFYFECAGDDFEFIAPKRIESESSSLFGSPNKIVAIKRSSEIPMETDNSSSSTFTENSKKMAIIKHVDNYSGEPLSPQKNIFVSHNIRFTSPLSTGTSNPFQNIRKDIRISFNVNAQTRTVDCQTKINKFNEAGSSGGGSNDGSQLSKSVPGAVNSDDFQFQHIGELPWNERYWHLRITNPVSTNEVWARFYDDFEVNVIL